MARIEIRDLPGLEDLTPEQLQELFGAGPRGFKPGVEGLEDRKLMSGVSPFLTALQTTTVNPFVVQTGAYTQVSTIQPSATTGLKTDTNPYLSIQSPGNETIIDVQKDHNLGAAFSTLTDGDNPMSQSALGGMGLGQGTSLSIRTYDANQQLRGMTAIANKVAQLGASLGQPLPGFEKPVSDGYGLYQAFDGKSIYWSPATAKIDIARGIDASIAGAHVVAGNIRDRYFNMGGSQFGYPTNDTNTLKNSGGAVFGDFYNPDTKILSTIVYSSKTGAHIVSGAIRDHWIQLGAGDYALPRTDQYVTYGAQSQDFISQRSVVSTIVWTERFGAHDVVGVMRDKWISVGRERFGVPVQDQTVPGSGSVHIVVDFALSTRVLHDDGSESYNTDWKAIALHSPKLPYATESASVIYGDIYYAWNSFGRQTFGIPTDDESDGLTGERLQDFYSTAGGLQTIIWRDGTIYRDFGAGEVAFPFSKGPPRDENTGTTSSNLTVEPSLFTPIIDATYADLQAGSFWQTRGASAYTSIAKSTSTGLADTTNLFALAGAGDSIWGDYLSAAIPRGIFGSGHQAAPPDGAGTPPDVAPAGQVADLTGVGFTLTSQVSGEVHQLQILTQVTPPWVRPQFPDTSAGVRPETPPDVQAPVTFTGTWDPAGADGGFQVTGTLTHDDAGNIHIRFTFGSLEDGTYHLFDGTITGEPGAYHLEGTCINRGGSGGDDTFVGDQTPAADATPAAPAAAQLPDFTDAVMSLTVPDTGETHQLQIQAQTFQPDGTATFTGLWDGQDALGTFSIDDAGNVHIAFSTNSEQFDGSVTTTPHGHHFLDGALSAITVAGDNAAEVAPDDASDQPVDQAPPVADFTGVSLTLVDDNGIAQNLQILDQTAQPDGSATFNAVWNGETGTGTLAYDAAGNVHVVFSAADFNFDGTMTGVADGYHLDGLLTVAGADPIHIAGDQIAMG